MAINKVVYGGETIIDLTNDTVSAGSLPNGVTAHDASGVMITGTQNYYVMPVGGIPYGDLSSTVQGMLHNVYSGTSEPAASLGSAGDLYLQYE